MATQSRKLGSRPSNANDWKFKLVKLGQEKINYESCLLVGCQQGLAFHIRSLTSIKHNVGIRPFKECSDWYYLSRAPISNTRPLCTLNGAMPTLRSRVAFIVSIESLVSWDFDTPNKTHPQKFSANIIVKTYLSIHQRISQSIKQSSESVNPSSN